MLAATGIGRKQSWAEGFDALVRAADGGDPSAARQHSLLGELGIRDATAVANWTTAVAILCRRILLDEPRMTVYPGFLAHELCAYLIGCAASRLKPALVHDARQGGLRRDSMRTNTGAAFSLIETDFVIQMIRTRIATAAGVALAALEPPEVLHYAPGERYNLHFDFFHPQLPHYAEEMQARGQRIRTCLDYLNAGYDGGETEFPKLNVRFRGGVGDALIFDNVTADGSGDVRTVHARLQRLYASREPLIKTRDLAKDTLDIVERRYRNGEALILDYLANGSVADRCFVRWRRADTGPRAST